MHARSRPSLALFTALVLSGAAEAAAQRLPFERTIDTAAPATLDVSTVRGTVDVVAGTPGRVVVQGTVTVRVGWDVPANAVEIARRVAERPPIEQTGTTIRLRPPADAVERRAVTVAYRVSVPPDTRAIIHSESGAVTVEGLAAPVEVRTQSSTIDLARIRSAVSVTTGSGAVTVSSVSGAVAVTTSSSGIEAADVQGDLRIRTASGAVEARMSGPGHVDVETGSSGITVTGAAGGLVATTRSGRVRVHGRPGAPWTVTTGSGAIDMGVEPRTAITVDAETGSGSIRLEGVAVTGTVTKRRVEGAVAGGGPAVRLDSRSGSIRVGTAHP